MLTTDLRKRAGQWLPLLLAGACVPLLWDKLAEIDWAGVKYALGALTGGQWMLAALATGLSFWAVGRYDRVMHGVLRTGHAPRAASLAGMGAISVSQTTGFGLVTGTLVRWRLLPDLGATGAAKLSALVAASFLAGWAVVTALALVVLAPSGVFTSLAWVALTTVGILLALSLWQPRSLPWRVPSLRLIGAVVAYCAIDTVAAALALHALLPAGTALPFALLLPAFLLALGAGLISGAPGGVGPFEVSLLALLPMVPEAPLVTAILAWRGIYYALPALLGALLWMRGTLAHAAPLPQNHPGHELSPSESAWLARAPQAEAQLVHQGQKMLLRGDTSALVTAQSGQSLLVLGDPLAGPAGAALPLARAQADINGLQPVFYKCGPRQGAHLRRCGFVVLPIAQDAVLTPQSFDTTGPAHRQLRRKLRKAEGAGLRCHSPTRLPLTEMRDLNTAWQAHNGTELGFSTGRFCVDALARQHVVLARTDKGLVGFASFHMAQTEWTLDLMRLAPGAPDGTMHQLVCAGIKAAAHADATRFNLAAVPCPPDRAPRWLRPLLRQLGSGRAGLHQFKSAFAPHWERRYIAAPDLLALALGGWDLWREITAPHPTPDRQEHDHEDYTFAPTPASWHPSASSAVWPVAVPVAERMTDDRRSNPLDENP